MTQTKALIVVTLLLFFTLCLEAQVTIGSSTPPHNDALLDLKEESNGTSTKGLLLPRVSLKATNDPEPLTDHVAGMTVYNTTPSNINDPSYDAKYHVSKGFYYNDGTKWEKLYLGGTNWFYMPSIMIPTSSPGVQPEIDLYALYEAQFSTPKVRNSDAPQVIPYFLQRNELHYYITDYDKSVFEEGTLTISNDGKFNYKVKNPAVDGSSYINIVFVIK